MAGQVRNAPGDLARDPGGNPGVHPGSGLGHGPGSSPGPAAPPALPALPAGRPAPPASVAPDDLAWVRDPSGFSFHQLVMLLDRHFADRPPTGSVSDARLETARFRGLASLGFPAADIAALDWRTVQGEDGADRPRLDASIAFLGLYGPASPLPPHLTEAVLGTDDGPDTLRSFLDLFNHRLTALAYRTWRKYRYYVTFRAGAVDELSRSVFALAGHHAGRHAGQNAGQGAGDGSGLDGPGLDWTRLLRFSGVLGMNCRSPAVLEQVVGAYFGVPARVEEAVARIVTISDGQQNRLGERRSSLASDWVLGSTVPDVAGKFRMRLGPLTAAQFHGFLPGGANHRPLHALLRQLVRDSLEFEVWVVPAPGALAGFALDADGATPLGWATWLDGGDSVGAAGVMVPY